MSEQRTATTIELPPPLADRVQTVFRFEQRPETFGDWGKWMTQTYEEDMNRSLSPEDLCLVNSSNHEARIGDDMYSYQCTLDALVVGYLVDQSVVVRSVPPTSDTTITVEFDDGKVQSVPKSSVLSFGIAEDVEPPEGAITPEEMYRYVCPYGHAFPSHTEYEEWAATTEAITTATELADGLEIARELLNLWNLAGNE